MTETTEVHLDLGAMARDSVTGFQGTITARHTTVDGEIRYQIEAIEPNGRVAAWWFDACRVEPVECAA